VRRVSRRSRGRNLLPAEAAAGVLHHVALSIVGIDLKAGGQDVPLGLPIEGAGFALQAIDEIDDGIEAAPGAAADEARAIAMARCDLPVPVPPISTALRFARSRISASLTGVPVNSSPQCPWPAAAWR
jgi:hypothetical protein